MTVLVKVFFLTHIMLVLLGFSLTLLIVVLVRSFSCTPHASFSEEFLIILLMLVL